MNIKTHIQNAINNITNDKEKAIAEVKQRVVREKINPHNVEVDKYRDNAIIALDKQLNEGIVKLRGQYDIQKKDIVEKANKNKEDFANAELASAVSLVSVTYDQVIANLTKQMEEVKE